MKRIIALLLTLLFVLSSPSGCATEAFRFAYDTSLTRGQWISELAATLGMDDYEEVEPYLSDVSSSDPLFGAVQSSYEWGVLRDVSKRLKKNNGASLEFVVSTAVYAIGVDLATYEGKTDLEKAIQYAYENNIVSSDVKLRKWAKAEQCQSILSTAQFLYLSKEITPIDNVIVNENVLDFRKTNNMIESGGGTYIITDIEPTVGEVYIAPGTSENPDGVAVKVTEVIMNDDGTYYVKTQMPELYEVFEEIEYAGVAVPDFKDIVPAEGVTLTYNGSQTISTVSNVPSSKSDVQTLSYLSNSNSSANANVLGMSNSEDTQILPLGVGTSKSEALSFTASCNFTNGKVNLNPEWGSKSVEIEQLLTGKNAGTASPDRANKQWFEGKSVFPDKTLFGSDAYSNDEAIDAYKKGVINADELREALRGMQNSDGTEKIPNISAKYNGGYEIVGSIGITDLYVVPTYKLKTAKVFGVDTGIPTGLENFSIEANYGASLSLSVKGKIEGEITVCSVPISLGGIGVLTLELVLYAEFNGELALKASITNNTKTEYTSGRTKKTSTQNASASLDVELELETGPKFNAKISVCAIPLINADVSAAVLVKAGCGVKLSTEWTETDDAFIVDRKTTFSYVIEGHIPIVKISIGNDESTFANKLKITFKWTIVGDEESNAPLTAAKFDILPAEEIVLWEDHLEIQKEPEETEDDNNSNEMLGSNMEIASYYIHLNKGESVTIELDYPKGYDASDFVWTSLDKSIVTVKDGVLTAKGNGSTVIKSESKDGKYYANCAVYVGE